MSREVLALKHKKVRLLESIDTKSPQNAVALSDKIEALKDVALALWKEVQALGSLQTSEIRSGIDFYEEVRRFEINLIQRALEHTYGNQTLAARLLGINVTTLNSKIKRYNLLPDEVTGEDIRGPASLETIEP